MIHSLIRKTEKILFQQNSFLLNNFLNKKCYRSFISNINYNFAIKKKRIVELRSSTIRLNE